MSAIARDPAYKPELQAEGETEDASSFRVRSLLHSTQFLRGCCYCDNEAVQAGQRLVTEYSALLGALGDGAQRHLSVSECAAVLAWLANIGLPSKFRTSTSCGHAARVSMASNSLGD